jgi:uncharacterized protein with FMN-binding domain
MTHPRPASLARRAFPALAVLGASGALLTQLGGTDGAGAALTTAAGPVDAAPPSTLPPSTLPLPSTTLPVRPAPGGGRTPQGDSAVPPAPGAGAPGGAAPTTAVPPTPAACTGTTHAGSTVQTRFGPVQVAAVVDSGKTLCDVQVLAYPDGDRRSLSINQRALPTLRTQAVQSNGKNVVGVSGATITADAYRTSLQAALDKAR